MFALVGVHVTWSFSLFLVVVSAFFGHVLCAKDLLDRGSNLIEFKAASRDRLGAWPLSWPSWP